MRFKNFSAEPIRFGRQAWTHPQHGGLIEIVHRIEGNEITEDLDPEDPLVQKMLKAHPDLRPYVTPTAWEHLLLNLGDD